MPTERVGVTNVIPIPAGVTALSLSCSVQSGIGPWLQAGAIVLSFVTALVVALITRSSNQSIARKKSTIDLIVLEQTNQKFLDDRRQFRVLREAGRLEQWADPEKKLDPSRAVVINILNSYEFVAVGIKNGAYCEQTYKDWCRTTFVKDWVQLGAFVSALRSHLNGDGAKIYAEYAALATKWANASEKSCFALSA